MSNLSEKVISHITSHGRISYRLGCNGLGKCPTNGFDCSGLIDKARRDIGYRSGRKLDSSRIIDAGDRIHYTELSRGDYIRMKRKVGEGPDHIAIVSRGRDGETIEILDMSTRRDQVLPRTIKITDGRYAAKFRIDSMRMDYTRDVAISRKTGLLVRL